MQIYNNNLIDSYHQIINSHFLFLLKYKISCFKNRVKLKEPLKIFFELIF